ncbi:hypothetical protein L618_000200006160 [Rhodococcus rhodochrous J45]|uniref:Uncharacterized protein n=1 Tax=Rhodococcus rhodochrous J45 TaxID=935266 RepID=A0A562E696_RHORH|nr:hypothetical protein L618_000200006160 [Rhodococcus rhodochrous J45]
MTPYGQAATQYPQPLQMSSCTTTVPNSLRNSDPVGHTSRHAAWVQCLHTSEDINQRKSGFSSSGSSVGVAPTVGIPSDTGGFDSAGRSMKATCRHWLALSE